ncbi:MAG: NAD(P)/FAD-dependent oxidoreductase [Gloeocapsa sp. DLM2.Bin57]|nr:MAG: NAD(P)/FAD-dependent oxidoreductase [Gloeocapsa sp. DLM2.Bin57]
METTAKQLIIGAGFVGLGVAQALQDANIPYDQVEASDDIGGNWYHGVYETAHIISSRRVTEFTHFPMPSTYPDFPSAKQMGDYLNLFADHYQLRKNIELNSEVTWIQPREDNHWEVILNNQTTRVYKGVIICNGHHWCKRFPEFQGEFSGEIIHTKDYKHPNQLKGKRVLVIGGGNSACDVAAEAARVAEHCVLSMRDSVWFIPKTFGGIPVTDWVRGWMPESLQRLLVYTMIRLSFGQHSDYGLPKPQHQIFTKHPTVNNEVPYYLKHGKIIPKPGVLTLAGEEVEFVDGSRSSFDLIVCGTGYYLAYPFLPPELQRVNGPILNCYGGSFLEDYANICFIGWGQVRGGVGSILSAYGPFLARCLQLQDEINIPLGLVFKEMGQTLPDTHLSDPHAVLRKLKLAKLFFPWIVYKAHQIERQSHGVQYSRADRNFRSRIKS